MRWHLSTLCMFENDSKKRKKERKRIKIKILAAFFSHLADVNHASLAEARSSFPSSQPMAETLRGDSGRMNRADIQKNILRDSWTVCGLQLRMACLSRPGLSPASPRSCSFEQRVMAATLSGVYPAGEVKEHKDSSAVDNINIDLTWRAK